MTTLFPLPQPDKPLPERMRQMRLFFGVSEGHICKTCVHLHRFSQRKRWLKCELAYQTHGTGTDWKASWQACGKWDAAPQ